MQRIWYAVSIVLIIKIINIITALTKTQLKTSNLIYYLPRLTQTDSAMNLLIQLLNVREIK